ncbi:N-acetylglucosamine-1-phosphotransferase subunits alpha/beta-like [Ruditapes philippinarum]|uniref:N-acetylglucosamine-1-phosphotransferase subunits alpha/beta-like n=1 Tax=Ruditapes philippinarum TaxID=129788 RepID=UPI00295A5AAE|nr:N-acetylglucosamine-1-phosphotransferase subunits alpha/beta-like [Ruditapes philippinarum]
MLAKNRYRDWGTLKYSLRSVEKFAPWIKTVHLVTSGQIPYWLNMDNRRINIITHKEIFPNRSDLPTFSTAAIECHLHRILGLSKRFIYMTDDVIFTNTVELSYFYTESAGYKLQFNKDAMDYCNKLCRMTSVNNGICEKNCATACCEFDGEDCINVKPLPDYIEPDKIPIDSWQASLRHTGFIFNKVFRPKDMVMPIPGPYMLDRDIVSGMMNRWSVLEVSHTDLPIRQKYHVVNLLSNIIQRSGTFLVLSNYFPENVDRESRERIFTQVFEDMLPTSAQFEVMKNKAIKDHSIIY